MLGTDCYCLSILQRMSDFGIAYILIISLMAGLLTLSTFLWILLEYLLTKKKK